MKYRIYVGKNYSNIINAINDNSEGTLTQIGLKCRKCNKMKKINLFGEESG